MLVRHWLADRQVLTRDLHLGALALCEGAGEDLELHTVTTSGVCLLGARGGGMKKELGGGRGALNSRDVMFDLI